jgi:uncharacterized coiled-coil protein SlyX
MAEAGHDALARRLAQVLGPEAARTLMNGLSFTPDTEIARRADVHALGARLDGLETRVGRLETRMDGLDARMDGLETRMGRLEARLDGLDARMGELKSNTHREIESAEHRIIAAVRGELVHQTRFYAVTMGAVVVAIVGAMAALG